MINKMIIVSILKLIKMINVFLIFSDINDHYLDLTDLIIHDFLLINLITRFNSNGIKKIAIKFLMQQLELKTR